MLATLHLLSLTSAANAVSSLLGRQLDRPVVEDELLDVIDEFELVDIPPDALLERIREVAILTPAQLALAMQRELRPQVLAMLRENLAVPSSNPCGTRSRNSIAPASSPDREPTGVSAAVAHPTRGANRIGR